MIYLCIFLTLVLLTFTQFGLLLSFKKPAVIAKYLDIKNTNPAPKFIFGVSTIVFFFLLFYFLKLLSTPQPMLTNGINEAIDNNQPIQQIRLETYPKLQNYYYLYTEPDKSEMALETLARKLKASQCSKPCTINFYDDLNAYRIDRERVTITDSVKMTVWNKKNYVFVANHYLGYLNSEKYSSFSYYPYKDWYYTQLTTGK